MGSKCWAAAGLVLACVVLAATASSAAAFENLPHLGRCVETPGGAYANPVCTKIHASATKHYEWEPLATAVAFTAQKEPKSSNVLFESRNGTQVPECTQAAETGEFGPGSQIKDVVLDLRGCKGGGAGCNTAGQPAERMVLELHGEPGIVTEEANTEKNIDGFDARGVGGEVFSEFQCGPAVGFADGGVVVKAQADSTGGTTGEYTNQMKSTFELEFATAGTGIQDPEEWTPNGEGFSNAKHERISEHLEGKVFGGTSVEGVSLRMTMTLKTAGSTKVELRQCAATISCPN